MIMIKIMIMIMMIIVIIKICSNPIPFFSLNIRYIILFCDMLLSFEYLFFYWRKQQPLLLILFILTGLVISQPNTFSS